MLMIWAIVSTLITIILLCCNIVNGVGDIVLSLVLCFFGQIFVWAIVGVIGTLFVDIRKDNEKDSKFFRFYAYSIENILNCVLRYKVNISGLEKLPEEKFLLVSNHRSAFDAIIQLGVFRKYNMTFVSKQENISMPIFGKIMHRCSAVSLDRDNVRQAAKAIMQAVNLIKSDTAAVGIYPEGTRNQGEELLPFKAGAFKIAQKANCPIAIVAMENSEFVMKNAPFRKTEVNLKVLHVLPAEYVKEHTTTQLSEEAYNMILEALENK